MHGDPATPVLETYPGDELMIRLIDGAHEEQHVFNVTGMSWQKEVVDEKSPLAASQTLGVSEAFNLNVKEPYQAGDYLYYFGGTDDVWLGLWGIIRAYDRYQECLKPLCKGKEMILPLPPCPGKDDVVMAEILTHAAFYAGWPNAWAAFRLAKEVYADDSKKQDDSAAEHGGFFGIGQPNTGFAKYFTGNSYLNPLTDPKETVFIANVTFEPGCRNNWHIHHASKGGGQILLCVEGEGWYQEEGKAARSLKPGDVVTIPAEVKHWHGAKKNCWFSHLAIECPGEETSNEWLEMVTDEEYGCLEEEK